MSYDSKDATVLHQHRVGHLLCDAADELIKRSETHDASKLESPEKELFDEFTPKLKGCTYGSDEYKEFLKGLKVALDHHYANNSHHPEHYILWKCPICSKTKQEKETWVSDNGNRFCLECTGGHAIYEAELTETDRIVSVDGFDLFDLIEMFFDWKAASERHNDGNIFKSIEINTKRFNLSEQVVSILRNTAERMQF